MLFEHGFVIKLKRVKILHFIISDCILYTKISKMVIFGLVFLEYFLKLSVGIWLKNYNLQGFKELQYVDLQLDLQGTTTWKVVRYYFQSFKCVPKNCHNFTLICAWLVGWFGSLAYYTFCELRSVRCWRMYTS